MISHKIIRIRYAIMYKRSVKDTSELLHDLRGQFALVEVLADEGVLEDIFHHHAVVRVLLHDTQNEVLGIVANVNVLREFHFVLHLNESKSTILLRSSSE